jgi:hypothetical protein
MATDTATRIEQLLDNDYAQEQLRAGVMNLRAAYQRSQKRRVKTTRDERLRRQVQAAAASIGEAASAFRSDRRKPKPRWGRRLLILAVVGIGIGAVLATRSGGEPAPGA